MTQDDKEDSNQLLLTPSTADSNNSLNDIQSSDSLSFHMADETANVKRPKQQRYQIISQIRKGGMGVIYLATDTKDNKRIAIKKVFCASMEELNRAMMEVWPVRQLSHEQIVSYSSVYFEDEPNNSVSERYSMCIVMDYFNEGDLQGELNSRLAIQENYSQSELLHLMRQVAVGLAYLHDNSIIHRDLKPMNIFRKGNLLKIGDFGLSKSLDESTAKTIAGTPKYMAPEVLRPSQPYTLKVDIWSLGVCFWHMMTLQINIVPYLEIYINQNFHSELREELTSLGYSHKIVSLVIQCLNTDAEKRPTAANIVSQIDELMTATDLPYGLQVKEMKPTTVQSSLTDSVFKIASKFDTNLVLTASSDHQSVFCSEARTDEKDQRWIITRDGYIQLEGHDRVLDIDYANKEPGAKLCLWHRLEGKRKNQLWKIDSEYSIISHMHGFALDLDIYSKPLGELIVYPKHGLINQRWTFVPLSTR